MTAAMTGRPPSFAHCSTLTDSNGMAQFALGDKPDLAFGYCTDDNARALLAAVMALRLLHDRRGFPSEKIDPAIERCGAVALQFLEKAQRPDGLFHNLMDAGALFIDSLGSQECVGRTIWACGVTMSCAPYRRWREKAVAMLERVLPHLGYLQALRARAYAVLGLAAAVAPELASPVPSMDQAFSSALQARMRALLVDLSTGLQAEFHAAATEKWLWWEPELTWGNARLPEALLRAGAATGDERLQATGLRGLEWLGSVTQPGDTFVPIGNKGWYPENGSRAMHDQQPIEACAMVDAWLAAARVKDDESFAHKALGAFKWFLGANSEAILMVRPDIGACYDGLMPGRVNANMGAESTLSYVQAHLAIAAALRIVRR